MCLHFFIFDLTRQNLVILDVDDAFPINLCSLLYSFSLRGDQFDQNIIYSAVLQYYIADIRGTGSN